MPKAFVQSFAVENSACSKQVAVPRAAMARAEPAVVDVHGAVWKGRHDYELVPSAKCYELFKMSYAAKV